MAALSNTHSKTLKAVDEMIELVQKTGPKKMIDRLEKSDDRASQTFKAITKADRALTDDEIMHKTGMDPREHQRALSDLKSILLECMSQLDLARGEYSEKAQRLYDLKIASARCSILEQFRLRFTTELEATSLIKEAAELEDWSSAIMLISPLIGAACIAGEQEEYERLQKERRRFKLLEDAFEAAQEAHDQVLLTYARSSSEHPELRPLIDRAITCIKPVVEEHGTFKLHRILLVLRQFSLLLGMDYYESLQIADEMDALLLKYPLHAGIVISYRNAIQKLVALIKLRRYEDANRLVAKFGEKLDSQNEIWFVFQTWHVILLIHRGCYNEGYTVLQQMRLSKRFETQSEPDKESWRLLQLYSEFFTGRKLSIDFQIQKAKPGDLAKTLLNEFPSFKNDHAGHYMSAIVLEVLIALESRQGRMYLIDRIESLQKFRQRHLQLSYASPSAQFIDMLRIAVKHDFKRSSFVAESEPLLRMLQDMPREDPVQADLVLPYDHLWHAIVERMPEEAWLD